MPCPRVARCLLLSLNALSQFPVVSFKLAPRARHVFFYGGKFGVSSVQLFLRRTHRVGAAQARLHEFGAFVWKARPFCVDSRRKRLEIGRRGIKRVQIGKLF